MISNSGSDERGRYSGGKAGDQTGGEWTRKAWYNRPWNYVLRYPDRAVAGLIAQLAGEAADNNLVGYDQNERTTFWAHLKASNYFPSGITIACEADCSAGVGAIVKAVGNILGLTKLANISPDVYTGNLRSALSGAGFAVLTDSKYLTSDAYLYPGDVLLYEGHHTAINLDWGGKSAMPSFNVETFIKTIDTFAKTARTGGYVYGDSHTLPPCADHVTACDRGAVARPLWDMGFHDQPKGGITVINMESYLTKWGFKKITDKNALRRGDIVLMKNVGSNSPNAAWHAFTLTAFNGVNSVGKYDFGSSERIRTPQPYANVPLNQWPGSKDFYCAFRWGGSTGGGSSTTTTTPSNYTFTPKNVKSGDDNVSCYLATEILKARGYQGVKDSKGVFKELELNTQWTKGDMAAMCKYKWDRRVAESGSKNMLSGPYGGGEIGPDDWADMLGTTLPFTAVELPAKETKGVSVLLCQEILRSRGIKGKDGQPLALDRDWGPNTEHAVKQYQKARKLKETGKVDYTTWRDMLGGI